jgi:hypothetical protein
MSTRESNHAREELRALLVLGIIGTLLGVRDVLNANLVYGLTINDVANYLILYWGAYVFLMAIGISDDWVYPPISKACERAAQAAFCIGISVTSGMALFIVIFSALVKFMNEIASPFIIAVVSCAAFTFFVVKQITRRLPKPLEVTTQKGNNTGQQN